jgi:hypothetical protein
VFAAQIAPCTLHELWVVSLVPSLSIAT